MGDGALTASLEDNIALLEGLFCDVDTMVSRRFANGDVRFYIFYSDGVTGSMMVNEHVVEPLVTTGLLKKRGGAHELVRDQILQSSDIKESCDIAEIIAAVTYGDTLLLVGDSDRALILSSKAFTLRGVSEPEGEKILSGPREGFTEGVMTNLSLIRRRLRTHLLKIKFMSMGRHSGTTVCVLYMDNIVNKKLLDELMRRLGKIDIDCVLDSNYLAEHIAEKSFLGLNTTGATERPDVVVGRLMEGRIALIVDGSPVALTVPYLMIENFQSNEDYYMNPMYTGYGRILRILCFFMAIVIPGLYISIVAYHHEILPPALMLSFAASRKDVPLPAALECFIMLIVFDILRETGVRTPNHVGQALSIVGALVIGSSAVEAKLVAAPMVIVVAIAGITILLVPRLTATGLIARYMCLILSSLLGLSGLLIGFSVLIIHMLNLQTLGIPSVLPSERLGYQEVKDTFMRAPWPKMLTRIRPMTANTVRADSSPWGGGK
ncbi:MAG: spore germination protein [Oscillospiraceae bacterium]|nr:spore germination protein [Oscillospiraceae bacterium]